MTSKVTKTLLSYAGEYLVAARLSLMGYLTTVLPKGAPIADILVYDREKGRAVVAQVKTIKQEWVGLGVRLLSKTLMKSLREKVTVPYIIVDLKNGWKDARFYIVPAEDLRNLAKKFYEDWLSESKHKKPVAELEKTPQPLWVKVKELEPYLEKWENLWSAK